MEEKTKRHQEALVYISMCPMHITVMQQLPDEYKKRDMLRSPDELVANVIPAHTSPKFQAANLF